MAHWRRKSVPWVTLGILIALIATATISGCVREGTPQENAMELNGTEWRLVTYSADGGMVVVLNGTTITLLFHGDRVSGSAGCNQYFGSYTIEGSSIQFKDMGSTEMYCIAPGVMEQESRYLQLLGSTQQYTLDGDRLTFSAANATPLLIYARSVPPEPIPLNATTWNLEGFHSGDAVTSVIAGTEITAVFSEDGRMSGSGGCNRYFTSYAVNGSALRVGPIGSTKMYCAEPAGTMAQESAYFRSLETAAGYSIQGDQLSILNAEGQVILSFRAAE